MMSSNLKYLLGCLLLFGVAMGMMEAIIVIYLRELYYPEGFRFPLKAMPAGILFAELIRELCTLAMLLAVALLSGRSFTRRFSVFILSFAIWDIFYYIGLKMLIGWPDSILTWDILFLIPVTWLGPVLAPLVCCIVMIALALQLLIMEDKKPGFRFAGREVMLILVGALLIFVSFILDFMGIIISNDLYNEMLTLTENNTFLTLWTNYVPEYFNWPLFIAGNLMVCLAMWAIVRRFWLGIRYG